MADSFHPLLPVDWGFPLAKASRWMRWLPSYLWQRATRPVPRRGVHLMIALADHFEPAIDPLRCGEYAPYSEQERRLDHWSRKYPVAFDAWQDRDGRPFVHTYF